MHPAVRGGRESWPSLEKTVPQAPQTSAPVYGKDKKGTMWLHRRPGGPMEMGRTVQIRPDHWRFVSWTDPERLGELKPERQCNQQKPEKRVNLACVVQRRPKHCYRQPGTVGEALPSHPAALRGMERGRKRSDGVYLGLSHSTFYWKCR